MVHWILSNLLKKDILTWTNLEFVQQRHLKIEWTRTEICEYELIYLDLLWINKTFILECIWRCHRVRDVGTMTDDVVPTTIRQNGFLIQNNQGSPVPLYFVGYIAGKPVFKVYNVDINVVPKASWKRKEFIRVPFFCFMFCSFFALLYSFFFVPFCSPLVVLLYSFLLTHPSLPFYSIHITPYISSILDVIKKTSKMYELISLPNPENNTTKISRISAQTKFL